MVNDWVRGQVPRPQWHDRAAMDHMQGDGRFYETEAIRPPPMTIERALREHAQINAQNYFLAVVTDEGQIAYFTGPQSIPEETCSQFFQMRKFLQYQKRAGSAVGPGHDDSGFPYDDLYHRDVPDYGSRRRFGGRHRDLGMEAADEDGPPTAYRNRKRHRANLSRRGLDDDEPPVITRSKRGIKVGDSKELWEFYGMRFKNIQQNACKLIAKIWVKAVAPKKQSSNPYTKGDEKAPDWWPKPWGPGKDEKVRHTEPDHLLKKERVHLLTHILRLIIEPNATQHPDIQKLNIDIAKLEELTMESLSGFFNENDKNNNAKKKPYLKEIFKVARHEEQFKRGEIDASTEVFVMADDKMPDNYQSDDDLDLVREDEGNDISGRTSRISPPKTAGAHSIISAASSDHSPAALHNPTNFMGEMPVRGPGPQYAPAMLPTDMNPSPHAYVESGSIPVASQPGLQSHGHMHMPDLIPSPHDPGRRSSLFGSPANDFPNAPASSLYPTAWQQSTTAPANTALYAFNTQTPTPPQASSTFVTQPGVPPQYLGSQYHSLPHPSDVYRGGGGVAQSPVGHGGAGYQSFLPHDGRGLKLEPHRGPLH
ncbi:hypothetical protein QBC34DRAFT_444625 [Podospora aff. communis PSN243]|uniref:Subtelomeric hrmA-associated cluster protein AFUB-079030/YDR124W-like helical bundle domain-containing protein n=1 Tax=Podospora aff. communis PSN243 TaxID=3040156 RepID=A0AAV9H559_9PEZI|nr:hypothetical protein QBC34DRAFT_444625 [Podospora aff. communis PSN243]